ncbi:MAG: chromosome segregation protein SMC [Chitinophagales bacterium]
MLLRRLSLHGFKSFADRLDLSFEPGITAIVGPNGSGKSNIADAIKWALGESSAKELRGAKMEDVIFNGSSRRRSLGLAEVTLHLDNQDQFLPVEFGEVNVTRRVYRSGDSEFLLNGVSCRLKDIHELFLDSGLGRNTYALLSQSDVDAVLSAHPEERRRLFEEAAGIAKFRAKKTEALRRLGETEQNLARVGDILAELTAQLGPLAEKARRAERHASLSEELRSVEVGLLAGLLQAAQARVEEVGEELTARELAAGETTAALRQSEARAVQARLRVAQAEAEREEAARQVLALATELERVEGQLKVAQERQARWAEERAGLEAGRAELTFRREAAAARAEESGLAERDRQGELAAAREELARRSRKADEANATLRRCEAELERKKNELIERMNEAAAVRNDLRGLEASRQANEGHRARLAEAARAAEEALTAARAALAAAEGRGPAAAEALARLDEARRKLAAAAGEREQQRKRLLEESRQAEAEVARLKSRHQVLSDWQRSREGYGEGPRAVLAEQAAGRLAGVLGTVAELITVPPGLEQAVELALGGSLQDVVVKDEETARRGIAFLKAKAAGRATFLPLALLSPRPLGAEERRRLSQAGGPGYLGVGDELVEAAAEVRPAVEYLLGRVLFARDLDTALRVGRAAGLRYLVVTTDGEVVRPGGAITGGREERGRGLLRRQRELAEVAEVLKAARERREALEGSLAELERSAALHQTAALELEKRQRQAETDAAAVAREVAVRQAELRQAEAAAARVAADLAAAESETGRESEAELAARLAGLEEARRLLEEQILAESESVREAAAARDAATEELTLARVALAEREKDAAAALAEAERRRAEQEALAREEAAVAERAAELAGRIEEAQRWEASLEVERRALGHRRATVEARLTALAEERSGAGEELTRAEEETERLRKELSLRQQAVHEAELQATRAELEAETVGERLRTEWGISAAEALGLPSVPSEERAAAESRVETLRRRLKALGAVDPESIGEYAALSERHAFLSQQHSDLTAARESLKEVLAEIEAATARRFTATFATVSEEFVALFQRIFGGGKAELVLTDPDNPAESGIEVYAQPPGKKPQSLLMLSTGERTMTAIALLFAMMKVRPAPFCVLDEVDAALDEANVDRFVALLREFSAATQFVVITHRRQTMEAAGILYGVTQEEPGTSRLVSVRLSEAG